jgi:hypothetical protein
VGVAERLSLLSSIEGRMMVEVADTFRPVGEAAVAVEGGYVIVRPLMGMVEGCFSLRSDIVALWVLRV